MPVTRTASAGLRSINPFYEQQTPIEAPEPVRTTQLPGPGGSTVQIPSTTNLAIPQQQSTAKKTTTSKGSSMFAGPTGGAIPPAPVPGGPNPAAFSVGGGIGGLNQGPLSQGPAAPVYPLGPYTTDPTGKAVPDESADQLLQKQLTVRDAFNKRAEERMMERFQALSGGNTSPQVQYGGPGSDVYEQAKAAQFARAKDKAGQISKSALTGLREAMAARGILGSGIEAAGMGEIAGGAAGGLQELNREQYIQDLAGLQHGADVQYGGGITQRGQDMSQRQSLLSLLRAGQGIY